MCDDMSSITGSHAFLDEYAASGEEAAASTLLCGRDADKQVLLGAYERVVRTKKAQSVFVHGESGSGKTCLVETLREPVCDRKGFFCEGKYCQNSQVLKEPYSAIMAAFSDLVDLVVQSEHFDVEQLKKIQTGLKAEAPLLMNSINLTPLLEQQPIPHAPGTIRSSTAEKGSTFALFKVACKTFLQVISSEQHPIVLFIDDIQWMDEGSRQLIEMFIYDTELSNVLFIFAYRDEESEVVQNLFKPEEKAGEEPFVDLQVTNLDAAGVHAMVCSTLGSSAPELQELSDLIMTRTLGHPFFVLQFLDVVMVERMLTLSSSDNDDIWAFDVPQIQREIMVSETSADLLTRKVEQLSMSAKVTLNVAALLGYRFEKAILVQVARELLIGEEQQGRGVSDGSTSHNYDETVLACLTEAVETGFIEKLKGHDEEYQFAHDKLQSAFQDLATSNEQERIHLLVGEIYLAKVDSDGGMVYNAAVHLNSTPEFLIHNRDQRVRLARINLKAARHCKDMSAFDTAVDLLSYGLDLLESQYDKWAGERFDLTFEMTEELATMLLMAGRFDDCKQVTEEVLFRATSTDMKINAMLLAVECRMASNEMRGSIEAAKRALQTLGVAKLPRKISMGHVVLKFLKVKRMMFRKKDSDILNLPIMNDRAIATTVRLLTHVTAHSLLVDEEEDGVYSALLAMQLTLKYGLSPSSATALCVFGVSELSFGNYKAAYRYGKLALQLMKQSTCRDADCPTVGMATTLLLHWKEDVADLKGPLAHVASAGLDRGDMIYGAYCYWHAILMDTLVGQNLNTTASTLQVQYNRICDLGQSALLSWIQPSMQYISNLRSESTRWGHLARMSGEFMEEETYIQEAKQANYPILTMTVLVHKAQLACYFGFYALAETLYKEIETMGQAVHLTYAAGGWYLFYSIIHFELYRKNRKLKHLRKARKLKRKVRHVQAVGSPNVVAAVATLNVKELSLKKGISDTDLRAAFANEIEVLSGTSYVYWEAQANQDAGFAFAKRGLRVEAQKHFDRAMDLYYNGWGSIARCQWLEQESNKALARPDNADDVAKSIGTVHVGEVIVIGDNATEGYNASQGTL